MGMKDWWKRLLARFSREEEVREDEQVVELVPAPAPEPEPEQEGTDDELFTEEAIEHAVFDEDFSKGEWDDFG